MLICSSMSASLVYQRIQMLIHSFSFSFSAAFAKLMELGVPTEQFVVSEPWIMQTVDDQKS